MQKDARISDDAVASLPDSCRKDLMPSHYQIEAINEAVGHANRILEMISTFRGATDADREDDADTALNDIHKYPSGRGEITYRYILLSMGWPGVRIRYLWDYGSLADVALECNNEQTPWMELPIPLSGGEKQALEDFVRLLHAKVVGTHRE